MGNGKAVVPYDDIKDQVPAQLAGLDSESEIVYRELVLPGWTSPDRHGFPRTLYGYVIRGAASTRVKKRGPWFRGPLLLVRPGC